MDFTLSLGQSAVTRLEAGFSQPFLHTGKYVIKETASVFTDYWKQI